MCDINYFNKSKFLFLVRAVLFIVCISISYTGCSEHQNEPSYETSHQTATRNLYTLNPVENCDDLLQQLKNRAIAEMEEIIGETMENVLENGLSCYSPIYTDQDNVKAEPTNTPSEGDRASEYSETNTQVKGVDEADFIKNDGKYIYILVDKTFKIIDAWPPQNANVISSYQIEGTPERLFIHNNKALIYASLDRNELPSPYPIFYGGRGLIDQACTYGYNCDFTGNGKDLKITVLDISDPENPDPEREIRFNGTYINSRRIGSAVHTVILFPELTIKGISYWPESLDYCWKTEDKRPSQEEIIKKFETLMAKNRTLIEDSRISDWLPEIQDTRYTAAGQVIVDDVFDCSEFYVSKLLNGKAVLSLVSFEMNRSDDLNITSILGNAGAVYASSSALYISSRHRYRMHMPWFYDTDQKIEEVSTVHKFNLMNLPADCKYAGSGVVKGKVLNQFSMDEYNGDFRIATTTGHVPAPGVHSTLSILREKDNQLETIGKIDHIAPKEDIRSVRFDGPRGFIVTFKKTDPLFAMDLSNPFEPCIAGQLKIPGYSTYMHLMDENHLLTIGYDAEDGGDGRFAWFQGIMLQIFDISNLNRPEKTFDWIIGTRGSSSEAATNHLAFNYYPPKDILALPMTVCEDSEGGSSYGNLTFSGLIIYDVTADSGFSEKGRISHTEGMDGYGCSNWWTNANTIVKRSIIMDNFIYSVTPDKIKIQNLDNLGTDVLVLDL